MNLQKKSCLLCLVILLVMVAFGNVNAFWHTSFNETYEESDVAWPWSTGIIENRTTEWFCLPWPPGPGPWHTWGKEDSTVYRVGVPGYYRAIWCAGLPNDREPGVDTYPENMNSWACWGPYLVTEDMQEAGGVFYFWGSIELYQEGAGDDFRLLVTDNEDNIGNMEDCCEAFFFGQGTTGGLWWNAEWNYADLDSAGDSVSYMPFYDDEMVLHERDETYICLYFMSNNFERGGPPPAPLDFGIVVDDFSVGFDDGLFDFDLYDLRYMEADDISREYYELHVNDPIRLRIDFEARGPDPEVEVNHVIYIDDNLDDDVHIWDLPQDTVTFQWPTSRYGVVHDTLFPMTYVPQDTGYMSFAIALDSDSLAEEWSDSNNIKIDTVYINQAQLAPWMNFFTFSTEAIIVDTFETIIEVNFEAYNSPELEGASISFFYDFEPFDTLGTWIQSGYYLPVLNGPDSFSWTINEDYSNAEYNLYAQVDDFFFPSQYFYAPFPLIVDHDDISEGYNDLAAVPEKFGIESVYPNPFNPTVEVEIAVPQAGDLNVSWYSLEGRLVHSESIQGVQPGYRRLTWTPDNLSSGMYLLRVSSQMGNATSKVLYLK